MSLDNTIKIDSTVMPSIMNIPTHEDIFGLGGYICVSGYHDLETIPIKNIKNGTIAYVSNEKRYYQYINDEWVYYDFISNSSSKLIDGKIFIVNTIFGEKLTDNSVYSDLLSSECISSRVLKNNGILPDVLDVNCLSAEHFEYEKIKNESFQHDSLYGDILDIFPLDGEKITNLNGSAILNNSIPVSKFENDVFFGNPSWDDYITIPKSASGPLSLLSLGVPQKKCLLIIQIDGGYKKTGDHEHPALQFASKSNQRGFGMSMCRMHTHRDSVSTHGHGICMVLTENGSIYFKRNDLGATGSYKSARIHLRVLWYFELE